MSGWLALGDFVKGKFFAKGELFLDEKHLAYKALGCRQNTWKNFWGLFDGEISRLLKISKKKGFAMNFKGEKNQLGGTFVIAPDGGLLYGHYQTSTDFEPDLKAIMQCLDIPVSEGFDPYAVSEPASCDEESCIR